MKNTINTLRVELLYLPAINFAMQQNRASLIRMLSIENTGEVALTAVKVVVSCKPAFGQPCTQEIDAVPAGARIRVDGLQIPLQPAFFSQLTKRETGSITVDIVAGGQPVSRQCYPVDLLPFNEWAGLTVLPEMLSAFIIPNHPVVAPILQRASDILERWTGNPAMDEYQSRNPDRVRKQMGAIYAALVEENIVYSPVLAGFEERGQCLRLAGSVVEQKTGSCLDISLLYASCVEAAGIHPLVVMTAGHAFAGGWLVPETYPDSTIDDVALLSKRAADGINEIVLVDTACICQNPPVDFDQAVMLADNRLIDIPRFIAALDVKRSRFAGIRPLPLLWTDGKPEAVQPGEDIPSADIDFAAPARVNPYDLSGINGSAEVTKQQLWERKLLDLSLRNNLLNMRITRNTLQLISTDIDRFEDALTNGGEFRIMPKPSDWNNPVRVYGLYGKMEGTDPMIDLIRAEISQKRLHSYLSDLELKSAMQHIYRSSRLSIEENGANTLFLAMGVLKWYETPSSVRPRYAPILLFPVEIIRKSAAKGFVIRSREEETMMNITLLEMLRHYFGITIPELDPLPSDENGIDVKLIYSIIRNGIKEQARWDVEEQAILGIFSFNKFIMWNDIHNNADKLKRSKLVASLVSGRLEWKATEMTADAAMLDQKLSPTEILLPINADSSQLEAIYEAVTGHTYVLHGPPGTGKSQTITNIIANALYMGKRVLFVAEKMAALSVVQNRLKQIGLAPFCLELHSNKAKKTAVLEQLRRSIQVGKQLPPGHFAKEANRLQACRKELDLHVEALHKPYPFGLSAYEAISHYLSIQAEGKLSFPTSLFQGLDSDMITEWHEAVEQLVAVSGACGHPYNHPLTGLDLPRYSAAIKKKVTRTIAEYLDMLVAIRSGLDEFCTITGLPVSMIGTRQLVDVKLIIRVLDFSWFLSPFLLLHEPFADFVKETDKIASHGISRDSARAAVLKYARKGILRIAVGALKQAWEQLDKQPPLPRFFGRLKIKLKLLPYGRYGLLSSKAIRIMLPEISRYQEEDAYVSPHKGRLQELYGEFGEKEKWDRIQSINHDSIFLRRCINDITDNRLVTTRIREVLADHMTDGLESFSKRHGAQLEALADTIDRFDKKENTFFSFQGTPRDISGKPDWMDAAIQQLNLWQDNLDKLKDWYQWLAVKHRLEALQIGFVADEYQSKNIPTDTIYPLFRKSFYHAAALYIIGDEPRLDLFKGKLFEEVIRKYKELASGLQELTRQELYARLSANIPFFTREASQNSEVGILQRSFKSKRQGMSIRRLFDNIPTLLPRMCPCMLMSPISVAQYIDPDAEKFDLIVFDEASQMPTSEAVGAIGRGKNVVIVGDPKQMPPTNFFTANVVDEDNLDIEDMESILDDCLALSMPSKHLLWHYRSKHESLIAFSNAEYYGNKLLTFPSPDNIESKVSLVRVNGVYDIGKTRQNRAEAEAVVAELERRLADKVLRRKSMGVVTFSSAQQLLVEDLLSALYIARPDLEAIALEHEEPLFVKNLENVQGDERDVIFFSVGYGPDTNGKVSMHFGPLNRAGGERRLNVAVSRARYEMVLYASLRSDQIDLNRTSSIGVAGLKRFLEYAEKKGMIASAYSKNHSAESLVNRIARELAAKGYEVHTNIGCSGYRIDVGIVDDKYPSNYILGILCDGDNYRQTKTARDREIVQSNVLKLLGWNIHRVWTMDWWDNPEEVLMGIDLAVRRAEGVEPVAPLNEVLPVDIAPDVSVGFDDDFPAYYPDISIYESALPFPEPAISRPASTTYARKYKQTPLPAGRITPDEFMRITHKEELLEMVSLVIRTEAPISRAMICKRILAAWNITRMAAKLDMYFEILLRSLPYHRVVYEKVAYYWVSKEQKEDYIHFRPVSDRELADIPPEEIANGVRQLLFEQVSLPSDELARLTGHLFGFNRTGSLVEAAMGRGIQIALNKQFITMDNGWVKIV